MVVLDSRPFDEYSRISIPTGINVPGAELVLRVRDIAPSPATTIVVNCAGRTRSIIGAQSLINAGVPNKVVALRNGTMGWHLAGLDLRHRQSRARAGRVERRPRLGQDGGAKASRANSASSASTAPRSSAGAPTTTRTTYLFDVRDPAEYAAGHLPGAISAPGGQLVQATDIYAGTLGARIVLSDDKEVRALMTASWLKQMGWQDVYRAAGSRHTKPASRSAAVLGTPRRRDARSMPSQDASRSTTSTVIDLSPSPHYRRGHIPGAWFAIRAGSTSALPKIAPRGHVVLTSRGRRAGEPRGRARRARSTKPPVHWLKGGNAAWAAAGIPLSTDGQNGRRAGRRLAQALRAAGRQRGGDERLSVVGDRPAGAHQARRHHAFPATRARCGNAPR